MMYMKVFAFLQQASRSALHKASVSGQYEEVKKYLSSGYAVDVKDQVHNYSFEKYLHFLVIKMLHDIERKLRY